jgi:hypothetical protein
LSSGSGAWDRSRAATLGASTWLSADELIEHDADERRARIIFALCSGCSGDM